MDSKKLKPLSAYSIALGVVAVAFLAGITGGCLLSVLGGETADGAVTEYLSPLTHGVLPQPSVSRVILNALLYPTLCFALGFAIPGVALIPAAVFARGFFLSYAVASFARVFGATDGTLFSLSLLGFPLLLSLPCLLLLGTHGLLDSVSLLKSARRRTGALLNVKAGFTRFGIALCALALAAAAEYYLAPALAAVAARTIEIVN
ncbi:MAG: stage II sporulation protein M [Oscillospiraceae bacterium]|nr:stage II sporulation protein M [Oscillospiraceae bacterium]